MTTKETDTVRPHSAGPTVVHSGPLVELAMTATGGDRAAAAALLELLVMAGNPNQRPVMRAALKAVGIPLSE